MLITVETACKLLREQDHIVILAHQKPDGDTFGSSFALLYTLQKLGKTARVECADGFPTRYDFLYGDYRPDDFQPEFVVACDIAGVGLMGPKGEEYPRVDLCIDHHKSNTGFAVHTLLDASSPATTQIMMRVIRGLGVMPDRSIANCLFTGLSTDTGCFRYDNVNPETHRLAAELIDLGAEHGRINKLMFDTKTRGRLEVEKLMMEGLTFHFDGLCAVIDLPGDVTDRFDVTEEELDGISAFPRRIEGVYAGVTIRRKADGSCRISLRTGDPVDASRICSAFGGGGHKNAAGCTIHGTPEEIQRLLDVVERELREQGL